MVAVALCSFTVGLRAESLIPAWNEAILQAVRAESTPPPLVARNLAILHLGIEAAHTDSTLAARANSVVPILSCEIVPALFPGQRANFELLRDRQLVSAGSADWAAGRTIAARVLAQREADGASRFVNYVPSAAPGAWRRTAPFFRPPELPQWSAVRPFVIADPATYVPAGPPPLDSAAWAEAVADNPPGPTPG